MQATIAIDNPDTDLDALFESLRNSEVEEGYVLNINTYTQEMYDNVKKRPLPYMKRVFLRESDSVRLYGLPIENTQS